MRSSVVALLLTLLLVAPAAAQSTPKLDSFRSEGRIASGVVAKYDLKEESTDFSYRIRAEYIEATVQKLRDGKWVKLGKAVRAKPPKPLDFWPVFKKMGTGKYRIVARAYNGSGETRQASKARYVRFKVVEHIPHSD
jgi:hypothetical protein